MNQFAAMVKARTMEFVRDKGTFFWNLLFPVILVVGLSFVFSGNNNTIFSVGTIGEKPTISNSDFFDIEQIKFIDYTESEPGVGKEELLERLRLHKMDMLIDFDTQQFYINSESNNGSLIERIYLNSFNNSSSLDSQVFTKSSVTGDVVRYVDWLVPGVIGMNMLFSCMFGVGFIIVRYRKNGVLKRLKATPVNALSFVSAQMVSRFLIVLITSIVVFASTNIFLKFAMNGSYLNLILITALAILCMISIGLLFAARLKSEELTTGLMNIINLPMIFFSGVFYSLEGSPMFLQKIAKAFPLTHFIDGARAIMLDGKSIVEIMPNILVLAGTTLVCLTISALTFKWE